MSQRAHLDGVVRVGVKSIWQRFFSFFFLPSLFSFILDFHTILSKRERDPIILFAYQI
jgi:hypothetical protein